MRTNCWVGLVLLCPRVYCSNKQINPERVSLPAATMAEGEPQETSVEEQLVQACQNGDASTLQTLMTSVPGLDLSLTTEDGATLITNAVIGAGTGVNPNGFYQECLQLLLGSQAIDLDTVDTVYGRTAAHWAVVYKRHDLLLQLMGADTNMTTPDFTGTSPFHLAITERASLCLQQAIRNQPREILEYPDTNGHSPLERAIQMGNIEAVKILVEAGASVNATDQITGQSPLHIAARNASVAIIEFLLLHDAVLDLNDVEGMTPIHLAGVAGSRESLSVMVKLAGDAVLSLPNAISGMTPLMYACLYGHEALTKYFLKKKVNGGDCDVEGKTALHWAAQCTLDGGSSCVQMLLKKHKELIEAKDSYGLTPLHCSAMAGQVDSINTLLSAGADISAVDNDNHTVGHWATLSGQPEAVEAVLGGGGSITTPDSQGGYPLHYAAQGSNTPLPDDEGYTEEAHLHSLNMQETLKLILSRGGDVECRDSQGMTPLHWALQFPNNLMACSILLSSGADPKARDNNGLTGLHVAAQSGLTQNCRYLIEHTGGSIAKELDNQGQSALFSAVESGQLECVEYLLQINLSPTATNSEGRSPAHVASTMGFTECIKLLHAYRADLQARSIHGATSMHEAAANGHTESLELLLACGVSPDDPAGESWATALHYAATGAHGQCVHTLLKYGANINAVATAEGEKLTPLDYCTDYPDLQHYLRSHGAVTGAELFPTAEEEAVTTEKTEEGGEADEEPDGVIVDQSGSREVLSKEEGDGEGEGEGEGVRVRKSSRPPTADRGSLRWEEVGGGEGEGEGREQKEEGKMRRPSLVSTEGAGPVMSGRPRLLERALSVLRGTRSPPPPPTSVLSSAVGFYAAHATILAATISGTSVGSKVTKVAEKVATDTAEDLRKAAGSFESVIPDLVWLREPEPSPRPPTPVLVTVVGPTPVPSPVPSLQIEYEPLERRMRKAKAQMDMSKSVGYRAVEELLKAQSTHTALRRQFEEARVAEMTLVQREAFAAEEVKEKETGDAILRKLNGRIKRADNESEQVHGVLDQTLATARAENEKMMGEMGVSQRPTVAQWLMSKQEQKKRAMQEALINWDRSKPQRETAILVQQMLTSQRAMRHAAWDTSKCISARIRAMKQEWVSGSPGYRQKRVAVTSRKLFPRPPTKKAVQSLQGLPLRSRHPPSIPVRERKPIAAKSVCCSEKSVRATPSGFLKMRDTTTTTTCNSEPSPSHGQGRQGGRSGDNVWSMGHNYATGSPPRDSTAAYMRATGPKNRHAPRTLHFLPPHQYRALKEEEKASQGALQRRELVTSGREAGMGKKRGSFLTMRSLEFGGREVKKRERERRASFGNNTTQYHSLADGLSGRGLLPRKRVSSVEIPVLQMNVLTSPPPITPSTINC